VRKVKDARLSNKNVLRCKLRKSGTIPRGKVKLGCEWMLIVQESDGWHAPRKFYHFPFGENNGE